MATTSMLPKKELLNRAGYLEKFLCPPMKLLRVITLTLMRCGFVLITKMKGCLDLLMGAR